jgi:hypothetical protein
MISSVKHAFKQLPTKNFISQKRYFSLSRPLKILVADKFSTTGITSLIEEGMTI